MKTLSIIAIILINANLVLADESPYVETITNWNGVAVAEMVAALGAPVDKIGYSVLNAPTKSWSYGYLQQLYPKTPENYDIQIMEMTWDQGKHILIAAFHIVDGTNRCFVAVRQRKEVRY